MENGANGFFLNSTFNAVLYRIAQGCIFRASQSIRLIEMLASATRLVGRGCTSLSTNLPPLLLLLSRLKKEGNVGAELEHKKVGGEEVDM